MKYDSMGLSFKTKEEQEHIYRILIEMDKYKKK